MFTRQHINVFVSELVNEPNVVIRASQYVFIRDLLIRHCPRFNVEKFRVAVWGE